MGAFRVAAKGAQMPAMMVRWETAVWVAVQIAEGTVRWRTAVPMSVQRAVWMGALTEERRWRPGSGY
jgi:hypothetical protein